ncbi:hypothetical protein FA13DRAFT_1455679 [Coprinellus micaceus]|uniref:Uncharacterized protein n=1 Tax=Coprinellus micaceus TaxID=71717 RepID=A0A4Y7SNE7_COPMI|nr:hypothetical protein FA13DRAFT_1455679 [Coprinellus micaceus]
MLRRGGYSETLEERSRGHTKDKHHWGIDAEEGTDQCSRQVNRQSLSSALVWAAPSPTVSGGRGDHFLSSTRIGCAFGSIERNPAVDNRANQGRGWARLSGSSNSPASHLPFFPWAFLAMAAREFAFIHGSGAHCCRRDRDQSSLGYAASTARASPTHPSFPSYADSTAAPPLGSHFNASCPGQADLTA